MISIHQRFGIGFGVSVMLSWLPEPNVWTNDAWTPNIMDSYLNCFEGWGSVFDIDKILCIGQIRPYNVVSVVTVERMNTSGHQIATSLTNKPRVQDWCWLTQSYSHLVNHLKVKEGYTTYKYSVIQLGWIQSWVSKLVIFRSFPDVFHFFWPFKAVANLLWYSWATGKRKKLKNATLKKG